jgi:hypothetical protein
VVELGPLNATIHQVIFMRRLRWIPKIKHNFHRARNNISHPRAWIDIRYLKTGCWKIVDNSIGFI